MSARYHDPLKLPAVAAGHVHEAAHAVLFCRYGLEQRRVSIAPVSAVWAAPGSEGATGSRPHSALVALQVLMAGGGRARIHVLRRQQRDRQ